MKCNHRAIAIVAILRVPVPRSTRHRRHYDAITNQQRTDLSDGGGIEFGSPLEISGVRWRFIGAAGEFREERHWLVSIQ